MLGQLLSVQRDHRRHGCAIKLQYRPAAFRQFHLRQLGGVGAGAAVVVIAAVLTVHRIPGVGQGDEFATTFFGEGPAGIQYNFFAHEGSISLYVTCGKPSKPKGP